VRSYSWAPLTSTLKLAMKPLIRAILVLAAMAATEGVVFVVLQRNLAAGVSPIEADSIGLPLFSSGFVVLVFAALAALGLLRASRSRWLVRLGVAALVLAALLSVLYGLAWADANHWPIAVSFCALALTVPLLLWRASSHTTAGGAS
jgi:hypothetical protein